VTPTTVRLRELREAKGLTQLELAERVGVRQATISDLETGKAKTIRLSLIEALTRELGVELSDLIVVAPERKRRGKG
jgi:transcriptional regulator with XRE-family HTH domain